MLNRPTGVALIVLFSAAAAVTGCTDRELKPLNPCVINPVRLDPRTEGVDKVDLLFVVDSSLSMLAEQEALTAEFPVLMTTLANGNDEDRPGYNPELPEFEPVSMHVGVITVDMGLHDPDVVELVSAGGLTTCDLMGDDGIMRTTGNGCAPSLLDPDGGRFLKFVPGETDPGTFTNDFACLAAVGADGCFIEQQLEAVLKALTPSDSPIEFYNGTSGQGGPPGANAGFVRDDSLIAIILVTDEDDCSMADGSLNDPSNPAYAGEFNPRCFLPRNAAALHPLSRYVNGLRALRPNNPRLVIFSVITGIPVGVAPMQDETKTAFYDRVLAHPDMQLRVGQPGEIGDTGIFEDYDNPEIAPANPTTLTDAQLVDRIAIWPACIRQIPGEIRPGVADPAIRLVRAAQAMENVGIQTLVSSICKPDAEDPSRLDFSDALQDILALIADIVAGACLPRPLNPDEDGRVDCEIVEVQPRGTTSCSADRGRRPFDPPREIDGRVVCTVDQVLPEGGAAPTVPGWFYDTEFYVEDCPDGAKQRISFTEGYEPVIGTAVSLECLQSVGGGGGELTLLSPCPEGDRTELEQDPNHVTLCGRISTSDPNGSCCNIAQYTVGSQRPTCNSKRRICMMPCGSDADCAAVGLRAYVCDTRSEESTQGFCVDPTCSF
jgi:hypothetical protein